jgi:hypothetical protein
MIWIQIRIWIRRNNLESSIPNSIKQLFRINNTVFGGYEPYMLVLPMINDEETAWSHQAGEILETGSEHTY